MKYEKGNIVYITEYFKTLDGSNILKGYSGEVITDDKNTTLVKIFEGRKAYWFPKRTLILKRNYKMKNYISLNGKKIPLSDETAREIAKSQEEELRTFKDCFNKVNCNKFYYLSSSGNIIGGASTISKEKRPFLPRKELVRKVQLYVKLLTVAEAVNDGWTYSSKDSLYRYISLQKDDELTIGRGNILSGAIMFKDKETAQKAIDICPEFWKEYLKIQ